MSNFTKKSLRDLKFTTESELQKAVIADLLSQGSTEEIENYIHDVLSHGCSSGIVSMLIYYVDTEKFFKRHAEEILELLQNYREECGDIPSFELNSNNLAWFGYEMTVQNIANQLELEY